MGPFELDSLDEARYIQLSSQEVSGIFTQK
jgi:hypothetical protein